MADRICPRTGELCTFDERFNLLIDFFPEQIDVIGNIRRAVGEVSMAGECSDGVFVDEDGLLSVAYCGNDKLDEMVEAAYATAETNDLAVDLLENLSRVHKVA